MPAGASTHKDYLIFIIAAHSITTTTATNLIENYHLFLGLHGDAPVYNINTAQPGHYAGMLTVGPKRLVQFLQLHLGLGGKNSNRQQRLLNLKKRLDLVCNDADFLYKNAYHHDPLGVAERLLNLWESWRMSGWTVTEDASHPPRMQLLYRYRSIFYEAGSGMAEQVEEIIAAVARGEARLPPMRITMADDPKSFPYLLGSLLKAVSARTTIEGLTCTPSAAPASDLGKLQLMLAGLKTKEDAGPLTNDGSVQLMYFPDDIHAATAVYSMMQKNAWKPLVINEDNGLLNGLALSHGKPVCDWQSTGGNGQILQLFFLATALFKRPLQSLQLQSFLSSPYLPFSRGLARNLLYAFCEKPGINNSKWNQVIEDYLSSLKGKEGEKKKKKAVSFWLQNDRHLGEHHYDTALLVELYEELNRWAGSRAGIEAADQLVAPQFTQLISICNELLACLQDAGPTIPPAKFERLQVRLFRHTTFSIAEAEEGCYDTVDSPGSVWMPADEIIWMNAIRKEDTAIISKYWYNAEKEYFISRGLPVPDESSAYKAYLAGISRMVLSACKRLVLVIPARYHGAEAWEPYCIQEWSQLIDCKKVSVKIDGLMSTVPWTSSTILLQAYPEIRLPQPKEYFRIPEKLYARDTESYTSLEKLLQHPVQWFFHYILKLKHTAGLQVPGSEQLMGLLADTMVQRLFTDTNAKEPWWREDTAFTTRVFKELDAVLATEGIPLLERVNKRQLLEFKKLLARNTGCLKKLITDNMFVIAGTQVQVAGTFCGQAFSGPIDLLLRKNKTAVIIDLKWARSSKAYERRLKEGRDLQLVIYRALSPGAINAGYFLLNSGRLLLREEQEKNALKGNIVKMVAPDEGVTTSGVEEAAANGFKFRMKEISTGKLEAGYHLPMEAMNLEYFMKQATKNLYPLAEKDGCKQPPYDNNLIVITGDIS